MDLVKIILFIYSALTLLQFWALDGEITGSPVSFKQLRGVFVCSCVVMGWPQ